MKVQEVMLRAMAKRLTWVQAAEILGMGERQLRRWHRGYEKYGYDGLFDRRRGGPSPKRVPLAEVEAVLGLYRERYFDLNVKHFHEKLREGHGIGLSYSWVKAALQGAGLVRKGGGGGRTGSGGRGGRCRGCCCTSMAASTAGWGTSAGTP